MCGSSRCFRLSNTGHIIFLAELLQGNGLIPILQEPHEAVILLSGLSGSKLDGNDGIIDDGAVVESVMLISTDNPLNRADPRLPIPLKGNDEIGIIGASIMTGRQQLIAARIMRDKF